MMSIPLTSLGEFSLSYKIHSLHSSHIPIRLLPNLTQFRLFNLRSKTLIPPIFFTAQDNIDPIFLRHLQLNEKYEAENNNYIEDFEEEIILNDKDLNPIHSFFKSRKLIPDPKHEGNKSWHIADIDRTQVDLLDEEEESMESDFVVSSAIDVDGILGEIIGIARNLTENSTLGDFLGSFVRKIGAGECVEVLGRMGEEGFVWSCLCLFEWMGLQEPSLVTSKACSVLFTVLGKAGMGGNIMIIFENLPRTKEFRDVRQYNAVISGLACCSR